jgi:transcriptional regulator with XRE-family HTH domain
LAGRSKEKRNPATGSIAQQAEILKRIGARIRRERNRLGLSLDALAKRVGISKMTLHRIETGTTSPSVITLTEISFQLKKSIESFIREGDPKVVLSKRNEQDNIIDPKSGIRILAPRGLISSRITLTSAEHKRGYATETHVNQGFEWAYFVEGNAVVTVGERDYPVEAGDCIFYDARFPHSIRVKKKMQYVGLFLKDD